MSQSIMRRLNCLLFLPLLLVAGCVHIHEGSDNATKDQLEAHLRDQLHCAKLELKEAGREKFTGFGKNDTGDFAIKVWREGGKIVFDGTYVGAVQGSFNGTAVWGRTINSAPGFHQSSESAESSFSSH